MPSRSRAGLVAINVVPFAVLGVLALLNLPPAALAVASLVGAVGAAAVANHYIARLERLRAGAEEVGQRLDAVADGRATPRGCPAGGRDATADIAAVLTAAEAKLARAGQLVRERETQLRNTLVDAGEILSAAAADPKATGRVALPDLPCPTDASAFAAAANRLIDAHVAAARRGWGLLGVLHDLPDPVLVFDAKRLDVMFLNAAAGRMYPSLVTKTRGVSVRSFFADPPADAEPVFDAPTVFGPSAVHDWLAAGRGGTREALAAGGNTPVAAAAIPRVERRADHLVTVTVRDLSVSRDAEAAARRRQRQLLAQRVCRLAARDAGESLEVIRTQANLIAQAAKQVGQRDRFLPKVERLLGEAGRQQLTVELLDWLGRLTAGRVGEPDVEEVRLGEVADDVIDRLKPALEERGNTVEVDADAGWVLGDRGWLTALATGLLVHANSTAERGTIRVTFRRRSAVQAQDEFADLSVGYPGGTLSAAAMADVRDPYRRPDSAVFDPDYTGGSPLGLAVAHKLAARMYGELSADAEAEGRAAVRVVLPTRIDRHRAAAAYASEQQNTGAPADAVVDWSVGGDRSHRETLSDAADQSAGTAIMPVAATRREPDDSGEVPPDETVANWFGPAPE